MNDGANEALARTVVAELLDAGLIRETDRRAVAEALATGRAKQDDWLAWIENGMAAKEAPRAQG